MFNFKNTNNLIYIIMFLGFLLSCILGWKYIQKYDYNEIQNDGVHNGYFIGKEGGTPSFWHEAHQIKKQIDKEGYFKTGNKYEFKYLPSKLVFIYYKIINDDIKIFSEKFQQEVFKINNYKFGLILFQNFLYFLSLLILFFSIQKKFNNNNFLIITLIIFLSFEPTLNQWNRVLFSESIFFSLQLLLLSLLISYKNNSNLLVNISIGLVLCLMYLQRTVSIYYFLIVIIYFFIFFKKKLLLNILTIVFTLALVHSFIGYHNFKRDGKVYFFPILSKEDIYGYFIPKILKYNENPNFEKSFITRHDSLDNFVIEKNLKSEKEININDRLIIAKDNQFRGLSLIASYPFSSIKEYAKSLAHYFLLKPNELYFLFENNKKYKGQFYTSEDFKKNIPIRIIYSIAIYFISFMGFVFFVKSKNYKLLFILSSSILYYSLSVAWHTQSSYLAPTLIYISLFFSAGIPYLITVFKKE